MNPNKDMVMENKEKCAEVCNELLRGELAAVETYDQAMEKFDSPSDREILQKIQRDHSRSAEVLREHIVAMGATPAESSGPWGGFVRALEGAAKMLGESPALKLLETGENHGISEYQEALDNEEVMVEIKTRISEDLLPRLSRHIQLLQQVA